MREEREEEQDGGEETLAEYQDRLIQHVADKHLGEDSIAMSSVAVFLAVLAAEQIMPPGMSHQASVLFPLSIVAASALTVAALNP